MRKCPKCKRNQVIEDGYCGHCRECTLAHLPPSKCSVKGFSNKQIIDWAERHGLFMKIGSMQDLRCAFEDAASMEKVQL